MPNDDDLDDRFDLDVEEHQHTVNSADPCDVCRQLDPRAADPSALDDATIAALDALEQAGVTPLALEPLTADEKAEIASDIEIDEIPPEHRPDASPTGFWEYRFVAKPKRYCRHAGAGERKGWQIVEGMPPAMIEGIARSLASYDEHHASIRSRTAERATLIRRPLARPVQ